MIYVHSHFILLMPFLTSPLPLPQNLPHIPFPSAQQSTMLSPFNPELFVLNFLPPFVPVHLDFRADQASPSALLPLSANHAQKCRISLRKACFFCFIVLFICMADQFAHQLSLSHSFWPCSLTRNLTLVSYFVLLLIIILIYSRPAAPITGNDDSSTGKPVLVVFLINAYFVQK